MIHLIYVSSATKKMDEDELSSLLEQARARNLKQNVTGMLLYADGNFIQVLEGGKKDVDEIYNDIDKDDRHTNKIIIRKEEIEQRVFPGWSMGFKYLTKQDQQNLPGYTNFINSKMTPEALDSTDIVISLLYGFKEDNR